MGKLDFRGWFEASADSFHDIFAIPDPREVAKKWHDNTPEKSFLNDANISVFAKLMAAPADNARIFADHINGLAVNDLRYDAPASDLVNINSGKLGYARGFITNGSEPAFKFFHGGSNAGSILIQHEPVIYTEEDEKLIEGIIRHEAGHAVDWLDPKFKFEFGVPRYRWNPEAYAKNITEARQHAAQLRWLLKQVGDVDKVMEMLSGRSQFRLAPALIPVAEIFLKEFSLKTESWAEKMTPLVMASALASPFNPPEKNPNDTVMYQQQYEHAKAAAQIVGRIIELGRLSNFVAKS